MGSTCSSSVSAVASPHQGLSPRRRGVLRKILRGNTPPTLQPQPPHAEAPHPVLPGYVEILDKLSLFRMYVESLESINDRVKRELLVLMAPHAVISADGENINDEISALMEEVQKRDQDIIKFTTVAEDIVEYLVEQGLPTTRPTSETCRYEPPEDLAMCQYCLSEPADTEYTCCRHRGACTTCYDTMQRLDDRCPHCRAAHALVLLH